MIKVNEKSIKYKPGLRLSEIADKLKLGADVFIVNGYHSSPQTILNDGDQCVLIKKGEIPDGIEILFRQH